MNAPRYCPALALPPYTFVPGQAPHPRSNPRGHWYRQPVPTPPPLDNDSWRSSDVYLWGIDLFNHGYYWEAHEVWESLWHACGRKGPVADFLKALIKLAAAGVKVREGVPKGVQGHLDRAVQLFQQVRDQFGAPTFLGMNLDELMDGARDARKQRGEAVPALGPVFAIGLRV